MKSGIVFNIQKGCINDGPGIRTTVFLKGCSLNCPWCHNFEAKAFEIENQNGVIVGKSLSVKEVINEVLKDKVFYKNNGGITLSGGEPLMQYDFALAILKQAKRQKLHTAVETSGYIPTKKILKIAKYTDLFLYDIKLTNEKSHKEYVGVENTLILENLKALDNKKAKIVLRCVIVPGVNDNEEHFKGICKVANSLKNVLAIEVLPYHNLGKAKLLNRQNQEFAVPFEEDIEGYIKSIQSHTKIQVKKA